MAGSNSIGGEGMKGVGVEAKTSIPVVSAFNRLKEHKSGTSVYLDKGGTGVDMDVVVVDEISGDDGDLLVVEGDHLAGVSFTIEVTSDLVVDATLDEGNAVYGEAGKEVIMGNGSLGCNLVESVKEVKVLTVEKVVLGAGKVVVDSAYSVPAATVLFAPCLGTFSEDYGDPGEMIYNGLGCREVRLIEEFARYGLFAEEGVNIGSEKHMNAHASVGKLFEFLSQSGTHDPLLPGVVRFIYLHPEVTRKEYLEAKLKQVQGILCNNILSPTRVVIENPMSNEVINLENPMPPPFSLNIIPPLSLSSPSIASLPLPRNHEAPQEIIDQVYEETNF